MPIPDTVGAFAIVPSNDLEAAIRFWERLGFARKASPRHSRPPLRNR